MSLAAPLVGGGLRLYNWKAGQCAATRAADLRAFMPRGDLVSQVQNFIREICDASMPRRTAVQGRKLVYWWTAEIALFPNSGIVARRRYQLAGRRVGTADKTVELEAYRMATRKLRTALRTSQERCWKQLCEDVDNDPWGPPYRMVMKNVGPLSASSATDGCDILGCEGGVLAAPTHQLGRYTNREVARG